LVSKNDFYDTQLQFNDEACNPQLDSQKNWVCAKELLTSSEDYKLYRITKICPTARKNDLSNAEESYI